MFPQIYCMMFSGKPLSDSAAEALFQSGCRCALLEKNSQNIFHDDVRGTIKTEFDYAMVGSITGIHFFAEISTEKGNTEVHFIIPSKDIEEVKNTEPYWTKVKDNSYQWN